MRDRQDDTTHRANAAGTLGRPLRPGEIVHHRDEDKANSSPANLTVQTRSAHTTQHNQSRTLSKLRAALRMVRERKKLF